MSEPRRLAVVQDYEGLVHALRARADELNVSRHTLDDVAGLPKGYSGKLLAIVPSKILGRDSFGPLLETLGVAVELVEDQRSMQRWANRRTQRKPQGFRSVGAQEVVLVKISRKKLRENARKGGKTTAANRTAKQRSKAARRAARAKWRAIRRRRARGTKTARAILPQVQEQA